MAIVVFGQAVVARVRSATHPALEIRDSTCHQRGGAVGNDGLVGPFSGQSELAPRADVGFRTARHAVLHPVEPLPSAGALGAEDSIQLLESELVDWIVLVDKHRQRARFAWHVVAAGGDP